MPTLSTMANNVLAHLVRESGTDEYWDTDDISDVINFIYRTCAAEVRNVKEVYIRNSVDTVGKIYTLPEALLSIDEVSFDGEGKDPKSIYEIKIMDDQWRTRSGTPDYYCLDYREGFLLLWYFPSTIAEIKIVGAIIPDAIISSETPAVPYANGLILEPGAVSFMLAQEGGGQNLERSNYWYNIFIDALGTTQLKKMKIDHFLRSIDIPRTKPFGPRYPSNYPAIGWFGR